MMTRFRYAHSSRNKRTSFDSAIKNFTKTLHNEMPSCYCWDDFLDFSRMSCPSNMFTLCKRLRFGTYRFVGNYLYVWSFITFWAGFLVSSHYFVPLAVIPLLWIGICNTASIDDYYNKKGGIDYIISFDGRVRWHRKSNCTLLNFRKCSADSIQHLSFLIEHTHTHTHTYTRFFC